MEEDFSRKWTEKEAGVVGIVISIKQTSNTSQLEETKITLS
jgi:hypothetical protein